MSEMYVETDRMGDDRVIYSDEPDHDEELDNVGGGTDRYDPAASAIARVGNTGKGREWDQHFEVADLLDRKHGRHDGLDPDAAFMSGTDAHPERDTHDEAIQVRQLRATSASTGQVIVPVSDNGVAIVPPRRERLDLVLYNIGTVTVYIGVRGVGLVNAGFPFVPGASLTVTASSGWSASVGAAASAAGMIAFIDQFRTDNRGN